MSKQQNAISPYSPIIRVGNYLTEEQTGISLAYSFGKVFSFFAKFLWLLFLVVLLSVTFIVWIWIVSFRAGWSLWGWYVTNRATEQQMAVGILYGSIISFVSPFVLFFNWAQEFLKQETGWSELFPSQLNLLKSVGEHLDIKLGSQFPYLIESQENAPEKTPPAPEVKRTVV